MADGFFKLRVRVGKRGIILYELEVSVGERGVMLFELGGARSRQSVRACDMCMPASLNRATSACSCSLCARASFISLPSWSLSSFNCLDLAGEALFFAPQPFDLHDQLFVFARDAAVIESEVVQLFFGLFEPLFHAARDCSSRARASSAMRSERWRSSTVSLMAVLCSRAPVGFFKNRDSLFEQGHGRAGGTERGPLCLKLYFKMFGFAAPLGHFAHERLAQSVNLAGRLLEGRRALFESRYLRFKPVPLRLELSGDFGISAVILLLHG